MPIVGIGASAGGLAALEDFFRACPADTGLSFVLILHLDPDRRSLMTEILQRTTTMPVSEAMNRIPVLPDHVYVIPPNREMGISQGKLTLRVPEKRSRMRIDKFLRALAEDQLEHSIGIILSGTGTDGTLGLRDIKGAGGICMVQEPESAKYAGMPESAISAGYATYILPVDKMPDVLVDLQKKQVILPRTESPKPTSPDQVLSEVLMLVRRETGHDFALYKKSTINRRIERRMAHFHLPDMRAYAQYLANHPEEVRSLFKEFLINVTSFFRDPESHELLKRDFLPRLLAGKTADYTLRVWVVACATGEEAYSIAILLREYMEESGQVFQVQIYATDMDEEVIAVARKGSYLPNISLDVTPDRLQRFFTESEAGYNINREIRDMIVFAPQDVIRDPPFTRLDLLSCRNLFIYLEPEEQSRLVSTFYYALKTNGILMLAASESISAESTLFRVLDRKRKYYQPIKSQLQAAMPARIPVSRNTATAPVKEIDPMSKADSISEVSHRALIQFYAPASVTTDLSGNILYVNGNTGKYLQPAPGPTSNNVVEMAREGLQAELRAALLQIAADDQFVLKKRVPLKTENEVLMVNLSVRQLPCVSAYEDTTLLLVCFEENLSASAVSQAELRGDTPDRNDNLVAQLEKELDYTKSYLRATIEDQQASNEELKSANEELQSTNEELQSTNEELETSKEELQSLNEETATINAELTSKIEQLDGMQNDMKNLLDNVHSGTLFLNRDLSVRFFTREARKIFRLVPTDIGRRLSDIKSDLIEDELQSALETVLDTLVPYEHEVCSFDGNWYLARIQPYRTLEDTIDGLVMSFTDITQSKLASDAVQRSETALALALEMAHLGFWEHDIATGNQFWSAEMFKIYGYPDSSGPMSEQSILDRLNPADQERVQMAINSAIEKNTRYDIRYSVVLEDGVSHEVHSMAKPLIGEDGKSTKLVGTTMKISDMSQR